MTESCLTCRFWKADIWTKPRDENGELVGDAEAGWCRRYPPDNDLMPSEWPFPTTASETWCGEYKREARPIDPQHGGDNAD